MAAVLECFLVVRLALLRWHQLHLAESALHRSAAFDTPTLDEPLRLGSAQPTDVRRVVNAVTRFGADPLVRGGLPSRFVGVDLVPTANRQM